MPLLPVRPSGRDPGQRRLPERERAALDLPLPPGRGRKRRAEIDAESVAHAIPFAASLEFAGLVARATSGGLRLVRCVSAIEPGWCSDLLGAAPDLSDDLAVLDADEPEAPALASCSTGRPAVGHDHQARAIW